MDQSDWPATDGTSGVIGGSDENRHGRRPGFPQRIQSYERSTEEACMLQVPGT